MSPAKKVKVRRAAALTTASTVAERSPPANARRSVRAPDSARPSPRAPASARASSRASMSPYAPLEEWFDKRGWTAWNFQRQSWQAYLDGQSGLINVPTGAGKTLAAIGGPLLELIKNPAHEGIFLLYITPLKAVARDIEKAIQSVLDDLALPFGLGSRTGDTSTYRRSKQKQILPQIFLTTPESLNLLLSYPNSQKLFSSLRAVVLDEWHELLSTKRGTQMELALSRLHGWCPGLKTWAVSATLKNIEQAAQVATLDAKPKIIQADIERGLEIETLLPLAIDHFPWAGHLGLRMLNQVIDRIRIEHTTLLFTNTRSFCERWFHSLSEARPDWAPLMAIHHGSLDKDEREQVEARIKSGELRLVVTTSSLDLGVDFPPVEEVFQIGSPKGVARLLQRAGRAAHRPGAKSHIVFVPTNALELVEISALRKAAARGEVEERKPLFAPLDVLNQHMVSCALSGGFRADELFAQVTRSYAYRYLQRENFDWVLEQLRSGGPALRAYPQYRKLSEKNGHWFVEDPQVEKLHRMNIGTISSEASIQICFFRGKSIGQLEESFVSGLKRGDCFNFAGRSLSFVLLKDMKAYVRVADNSREAITPRWMGSRIPLSSSLSNALRNEIGQASTKHFDSLEMQALQELFARQARVSKVPLPSQCLSEVLKSRDGTHLFIYPFEGRAVHEGLAAILALRFSRFKPGTFSLAMNDYGIEILSATDFPFLEALATKDIFNSENLLVDIIAALNLTELARRQFREIARVAGLTFQNFGAARKSARQVQASSGLLYDVLRRYDPANLLINQAETEVREAKFEESRLVEALRRLSASELVGVTLEKPSPLSFPLIVDRLGARLSNESLLARIERMKKQWN